MRVQLEGAGRLAGIPLNVFLVHDKTIAVIGAGSIGAYVVDALYQKGHKKIIATRRSKDALQELVTKYSGIEVTTDNKYAVRNSDVVILAVKPKVINYVLSEAKEYIRNKFVISLAALGKIKNISGRLYDDTRVARVMTGLVVGDEIAAYTLGPQSKEEDVDIIQYVFGQDAQELEEQLLANRVAIACDTGLIAKGIHAKVRMLSELGLEPEKSQLFYAGLLEGIAEMLRSSMTGNEIYEQVGGPGSFTQKLGVLLEERGIYDAQEEAIKVAVKACRE